MARNPKQTVDYFPHMIGGGKKMFTIQTKYGNDGYATWFKLLEILCETNNHYLDLSQDVELMYVASRCGVTDETLIEIIDDLVKLKEIDFELWTNCKIVWNQGFIDSIEDAYKKRTNKCITRGQLIASIGINEVIKEKPQKTKKETPKVQKFDFRKAFIKDGAPEDALDVWLKFRSNKRAVNSELAYKAFCREVNKANWTIKDAMVIVAESSWQTFKASYVANKSQSVKQTHNNSGDDTNWEDEIKNV